MRQSGFGSSYNTSGRVVEEDNPPYRNNRNSISEHSIVENNGNPGFQLRRDSVQQPKNNFYTARKGLNQPFNRVESTAKPSHGVTIPLTGDLNNNGQEIHGDGFRYDNATTSYVNVVSPGGVNSNFYSRDIVTKDHVSNHGKPKTEVTSGGFFNLPSKDGGLFANSVPSTRSGGMFAVPASNGGLFIKREFQPGFGDVENKSVPSTRSGNMFRNPASNIKADANASVDYVNGKPKINTFSRTTINAPIIPVVSFKNLSLTMSSDCSLGDTVRKDSISNSLNSVSSDGETQSKSHHKNRLNKKQSKSSRSLNSDSTTITRDSSIIRSDRSDTTDVGSVTSSVGVSSQNSSVRAGRMRRRGDDEEADGVAQRFHQLASHELNQYGGGKSAKSRPNAPSSGIPPIRNGSQSKVLKEEQDDIMTRVFTVSTRNLTVTEPRTTDEQKMIPRKSTVFAKLTQHDDVEVPSQNGSARAGGMRRRGDDEEVDGVAQRFHQLASHELNQYGGGKSAKSRPKAPSSGIPQHAPIEPFIRMPGAPLGRMPARSDSSSSDMRHGNTASVGLTSRQIGLSSGRVSIAGSTSDSSGKVESSAGRMRRRPVDENEDGSAHFHELASHELNRGKGSAKRGKGGSQRSHGSSYGRPQQSSYDRSQQSSYDRSRRRPESESQPKSTTSMSRPMTVSDFSTKKDVWDTFIFKMDDDIMKIAETVISLIGQPTDAMRNALKDDKFSIDSIPIFI